MADNARFHNKLHRKNHHTIPSPGYPDSATDPIASPEEPFQGDLVVNGTLSGQNLWVNNTAYVGGDTTIMGSISVFGENSYLDTFVTVTSSMSVINHGFGPALTVLQSGPEPIARFLDGDAAGSENAFLIADTGQIVINADRPVLNRRVTISGSITASGNTEFQGGSATGPRSFAANLAAANNWDAAGFNRGNANGMRSFAINENTLATASGSFAQGHTTRATGNYSHAEGYITRTVGKNSHAEGFNTFVSGDESHVEGITTTVVGSGSHAEGLLTYVSGPHSHAEGITTLVSGSGAHAEGINTRASSRGGHTEGELTVTHDTAIAAHTEGYMTTAFGPHCHAEGQDTCAFGGATHTEGYATSAFGAHNHAEGYFSIARGAGTHAEGYYTSSRGDGTHTEGYATSARGSYGHAEGYMSSVSGMASHAEGIETLTFGPYSHAEGYLTVTRGIASHTEGYATSAIGPYSHAQGNTTVAFGDYSHTEGELTYAVSAAHAEGRGSEARSPYSHAEGFFSQTLGLNAHAEGAFTVAQGINAHAEGIQTEASGLNSHAEGLQTKATGLNAHAEGALTLAQGINSHAEGFRTRAIGDFSHAEGFTTRANGGTSYTAGLATSATGLISFATGVSGLAQATGSYSLGFLAYSEHDLSYCYSTSGFLIQRPVRTTRTSQYLVSAAGGVFIPGYVGIGTDSIDNALTVNGDVSITGNLSVFGDLTYLDTIVSVTSSLSVVNVGTGPAVTVRQSGNQPIARFIDTDASGVDNMALFIENDGNIGMGTAVVPDKLNVRGNTNMFRLTAASSNFYTLTARGLSATSTEETPHLFRGRIGVNTDLPPITSFNLHIKGGNIRVDGADYSWLPGFNGIANGGYDTDGQSLFDLRSAGPNANYNLSIASSGVGHFMKFFGGRTGDPNPFIVVRTNDPLRFASFSNFWNFPASFVEHMRIDTQNSRVGIGTEAPGARLTVVGAISGNNWLSAGNINLQQADVRTFVNPATATGDFLVLNINGTNRALRLWNFTN